MGSSVSDTQLVSMFNNAQNTLITGGSFSVKANINNFNKANDSPLDVLHKHVAPYAILNGRADKVSCHPGTRKDVLGRIEQWRDRPASPILWLSGPAGAGKSAIVQTVVELCEQRRVPQANFFFNRADISRNNASPLIPTLLHQLILLYASLKTPVEQVLRDDPLIFGSVIEKQLTQLIVTPLLALQHASSSYHPPLILIDGLDECDSENKNSQLQILRALDNTRAEHSHLFRLLVASRDDTHIRMAFSETSSPLLSLYLDETYSPENDIRIFVTDQFERVKKAHPLAKTLPETWPSEQDIQDIVVKSSGQFIYPATVMRFILDSPASPMLSLEKVQGAAKIGTKSPFSQLDAVYPYILAQVDDKEALKDILHTHFLIMDTSSSNYEQEGASTTARLPQLLGLYNARYTEVMIRSCLADLSSIARYTDDGELLFYHASFSDYLLDQSRSGHYFVDLDAFSFNIMPILWKHIGFNIGVEVFAYSGLRRLRKLPPDFLSTISALPSDFRQLGSPDIMKIAFELIYNLCTCDDDVTSYKQIIWRWINTLEKFDIFSGIRGPEQPPCSRKYFVMALIRRDFSIGPTGKTIAALCPETKFDKREVSLWLTTRLHDIHREYYTQENRRYKILLKEWILWAIENNIPLGNLKNLPHARRYLLKSKISQWTAEHFKIQIGETK